MNEKNYDFVIVGGGVIGLALARELCLQKIGRVKVIEKEPQLGVHSSGRNSGVLHSGIYYPPGSLKARLCVEGAGQLRKYLIERSLPHVKCGKLIIPQRPELEAQINFLKERSKKNGVNVSIVDRNEIVEIEPTVTHISRALYSPDTWIFEPKSVLESFSDEIFQAKAEVSLDEGFISFNPKTQNLQTTKGHYNCGLLINTAGLWADEVAHSLGVGLDYKILPFRGTYYKLADSLASQIKGLIYPVPDLELPFLGLHVTRGAQGGVTLGPTATPAFGREHYNGLSGIRLKDSLNITSLLVSFLLKDRHNMRRHMWEELRLNSRSYFTHLAQRLVPKIQKTDLLPSSKMGLRAQVVKKSDLSLCMDFLVEKGEHSVHVINAVSPAFSSCRAFARWVIDEHIKNPIADVDRHPESRLYHPQQNSILCVPPQK